MTLAEQSQSNAAAHSAQPGAAPSQQSQNTQRAELRENAMLKHGRSTFTSDILGAMTTKHNQVFMLTTNGGDIPPDNSGLGLYFRDTRYLGRLELRLEGLPLTSLLANPSRGDSATFELTNPDLPLPNGGYLPKERLSVRREQRLDERVSDTLALHNLSTEALDLELTVTVGSAFTNMFVVRGAKPGKRGTVHPPAYQEGALRLVYDGADQHRRTTTLRFDPTPDGVDIPTGAGADSATVRWSLRLEARAEQRITLTIELADDDLAQSKGKPRAGQAHSPATGASRRQDMIAALDHLPQVETNNPLFDLALQRSFNDLRMLAMADHGDLFFAAGVPWYVALFGRDSLITAFETLAFQPAIARSTLEVLAQYQGTERNDFQDEEPGKILHELRVGEKANLHEVPQIPYYGTVDATPWFLILLHEYVRWTGDLDFFKQLRENVERALGWIDANLQQPLPGFLSYGTRSSKGLVNQGWKDSYNCIVNADGSLAEPPIALVEVQGYVYGAWHGAARLFRLAGDAQQAAVLERKAAELKQRFNARYWAPERNYYALALQRDARPALAVASNPGQALLFGIADPDKAQAVAQRVMAQDMFCGWGVRTLSSDEVAYNPLDYQVGSVWPHDNALIALGLRRSGFAEQAGRVFTGIFQAATQFPEYRLPEVFDGFAQDQYNRPVRYPVACNPQAWAAGALPQLLTAALGLEPDAGAGLLRIRNPHLPSWLSSVTVRGLRVGAGSADLRYEREDETTLVATLRCEDLRVAIEY